MPGQGHGAAGRSWARFAGRLARWVAGLGLVAATASGVLGREAVPGAVNCYVLLEGEPAVLAGGGGVAEASQRAAAVRARRSEIEVQQRALTRGIESLGGEVQASYQLLVNCVRVRLPAEQATRLARMPGVRSVRPVRHFARHTASSVPFIGAPAVWSAAHLRATGKGIRIGIIDGGIDYLHADFGGAGSASAFQQNNPAVIEPGTFPTWKVVGGWDFAGRNYDSSQPGSDVPAPDADPLDCQADGHGTHVAGIAAGTGVLTNGVSYTGSYASLPPSSAFRIAPGVAPEASLVALKVFGCTGTTALVVDALEWAADPNGDGDVSDRLEVVNLSLGSPFGLEGEDDPEEEAANRLAELGTVVVVSAGNEGNTFFVVSAPGTAVRVVTVASSTDDSQRSAALRVVSPPEIAGLYAMAEGAFTTPLGALGPIEGEVVSGEPVEGCEPLLNAGEVAGKIVLVDRGSCLFVEKVRHAQAAGAIAVVVANHVAGDPLVMGGDPDFEVRIPGVMISKATGDLIKGKLEQRPRLRLETGLSVPTGGDRLASSSSRGPAMPGGRLKPDVAAPGEWVFSAQAGSGNQGRSLSGTSMAAPHVAGAAALLREAHPNWGSQDVKAALMNTSIRLRSEAGWPYPESQAGAGRIRVPEAVATTVTAAAAGNAEGVALNLGELVLTEQLTTTRNVVLRNHGETARTFRVAVSNNVVEAGFTVEPLQAEVTVPAGGSVSTPVRVTADPARFDRSLDPVTPEEISGSARFAPFEVSGHIVFEDGSSRVEVPYYGVVRAGSAWTLPVEALALPGTGMTTFDLPLLGMSSHPESLVSVFQLGLTNATDPGLGDGWGAADLVAVGAACNVGTAARLEDATVFFGLVTAEPMSTPGGFQAQAAVEIDRDFDGWADFTLYNSSQGNQEAEDVTDPEAANDVFMAVLVDEAMGTPMAARYLNHFSPALRDTAAFHNRVYVLPVRAGDLLLSAGRSAFQYRVLTTGPYARFSPAVDQSDWVRFDAGAPYADSTAFGLEQTPFFAGAGLRDGVRVRTHEAAAAKNGLAEGAPGGVLLLYHFNPAPTAYAVLRLHRGPQETVPLKLLGPRLREDGLLELKWTSSPGKTYRVREATDLGSGFGQVAAEHVPSTPPYNVWTRAIDGMGGRFFRVEEE